MKPKDRNEVFKNVTRFATEDERQAVERIDLDPRELDNVMEMLRKGLIEAASIHEAAVQDNMALRVETSIRLSRPVYNDESDSVEELVGKAEVQSEVTAKKVRKKGT